MPLRKRDHSFLRSRLFDATNDGFFRDGPFRLLLNDRKFDLDAVMQRIVVEVVEKVAP